MASGSAFMDSMRRMSSQTSSLAHSRKAFMYRFPRPGLWMQVPPRRFCFHDPQDGVKHQAVILMLPSTGFGADLCQYRPDYDPLFV